MRRYIFIFTSLFFLNIFSDEEVEKKIKALLPNDLTINFIDQAELDSFFVVNVDNNQILFISYRRCFSNGFYTFNFFKKIDFKISRKQNRFFILFKSYIDCIYHCFFLQTS